MLPLVWYTLTAIPFLYKLIDIFIRLVLVSLVGFLHSFTEYFFGIISCSIYLKHNYICYIVFHFVYSIILIHSNFYCTCILTFFSLSSKILYYVSKICPSNNFLFFQKYSINILINYMPLFFPQFSNQF